MNRTMLFVLTAIALVTMILTNNACGSSVGEHIRENAGGHGGGPSNDASEITVRVADFAFDPAEVTIPAGETVAITLQNEDQIEHDLQVDGLTIEQLGDSDMAGDHEGADASTLALHAMAGESVTLTFRTNQTGTFEFYCTITGHRGAGMVGTLTVE